MPAFSKEMVVVRQGKPLILYAGLLHEAHRQGLQEIFTELLQIPSDENGQRAVVKATVVMAKSDEHKTRRFGGLGDADASNTNRTTRFHLIRMAETRAKARALRDAIDVGMVAVEEVGDVSEEVRQTKLPYVPDAFLPQRVWEVFGLQEEVEAYRLWNHNLRAAESLDDLQTRFRAFWRSDERQNSEDLTSAILDVKDECKIELAGREVAYRVARLDAAAAQRNIDPDTGEILTSDDDPPDSRMNAETGEISVEGASE